MCPGGGAWEGCLGGVSRRVVQGGVQGGVQRGVQGAVQGWLSRGGVSRGIVQERCI